MEGVRLILALHDHQPVGNFDDVFGHAYRTAYRPTLDVLEDYPTIAFALHTSGPLLEWLVERHPEYVERLRALAQAGRLEILGGGFFEPILTMIPRRDALGQIGTYSAYLTELFGTPIRGLWVPERVWEPQLASTIAEAGLEYTLLDDAHFARTGLDQADLWGHWLTEDQGRLLKVLPTSERLRYLIPFEAPHATYEFLRRLADGRPGAIAVFADDGEKLGAWPDTFEHVHTQGWLRRFCDMVAANGDWLRAVTPSSALDSTLPGGKVYLPDASYREMTEWVLPAEAQGAYHRAVREAQGKPGYEAVRPYVRAGGTWRNFRAKYPEADAMYTRMLGVSGRLAAAEASPGADPEALDAARWDLYRGQCNCAYWHGAFGGLYLPHLRHAVHRHLIAADAALDAAEGRLGPYAEAEIGDFNLDARQEVRLANDRLTATVRPARGGHIDALEIRHALTDVLATLARRPEPYHGAVRAAASGDGRAEHLGPAVSTKVVLKSDGLDRAIVYDRHPRKALVDHVYPPGLTLDDLIAGREAELGDFVEGTYLARVRRQSGRVEVVMERPGLADGHAIGVRKTVAIEAGSPALEVIYEWEDLPEGVPLRLAVEVNVSGMAGHAADRLYRDARGDSLGPLDTPLDLADCRSILLTDAWLDLDVGLSWSRPGGLWAFPIETVSQSEGGFEKVYQGSALVLHWLVTADASRRWELRLRWTLDRLGVASVAEVAGAGRAIEVVR